MSIQFRKRIRLFPGVHLNISKSGLSLSFGFKGATSGHAITRNRLESREPESGIAQSAGRSHENGRRDNRPFLVVDCVAPKVNGCDYIVIDNEHSPYIVIDHHRPYRLFHSG
jgi:hypothetical protein